MLTAPSPTSLLTEQITVFKATASFSPNGPDQECGQNFSLSELQGSMVSSQGSWVRLRVKGQEPRSRLKFCAGKRPSEPKENSERNEASICLNTILGF